MTRARNPLHLEDRPWGRHHVQQLNLWGRDVLDRLSDAETTLAQVADEVRGPALRGTGDVLWAWDGLTTDQFGTTSLTTPSAGSAALSVVHNASSGPSLRITCSALQGRWFVPILTDPLPRRYVLRFRVVPSAVNSNNMVAVLVCSNNSAGSSLYAVELSQSSSTSLQSYKCEAGTFTVSGGAGGLTLIGQVTSWPGTLYELEVETYDNDPLPGTPSVGIFGRGVSPNGSASASQLSSDYSFGSWAGVRSTGVALGANADALASSITIDYQDLAILRHPLDR